MLAHDIGNIRSSVRACITDVRRLCRRAGRALVGKSDNILTASFRPSDEILVRVTVWELVSTVTNKGDARRLLKSCGAKSVRQLYKLAVGNLRAEPAERVREVAEGVSARSASWSDKQAIVIRCSLTLQVKRSNCPFSQELDTHWPNHSITYLSIAGLKSLYYTQTHMHLKPATLTRSRNHGEWPIDLSNVMNNLRVHICALIDWASARPQADRIVQRNQVANKLIPKAVIKKGSLINTLYIFCK